MYAPVKYQYISQQHLTLHYFTYSMMWWQLGSILRFEENASEGCQVYLKSQVISSQVKITSSQQVQVYTQEVYTQVYYIYLKSSQDNLKSTQL